MKLKLQGSKNERICPLPLKVLYSSTFNNYFLFRLHMLCGAVQGLRGVPVPLLEVHGGELARMCPSERWRGTVRVQTAVQTWLPLGAVEKEMPEERLMCMCFFSMCF